MFRRKTENVNRKYYLIDEENKTVLGVYDNPSDAEKERNSLERIKENYPVGYLGNLVVAEGILPNPNPRRRVHIERRIHDW